MTVLLASELTEADVALLTRPESPARLETPALRPESAALRSGGLRLMALASGIRPAAAVAVARPGLRAVPPLGWPGGLHDLSGAMHAR